MASRVVIIGAIVVVIVILGAGALVIFNPAGGGGEDGGSTWTVSSGNYVNYTMSLSNGSLIGYWRLQVVEVVPEAESITWNVTQTINGMSSSWQVATDWHHLFSMERPPIGAINETLIAGMSDPPMTGVGHETQSLSTNWGSKSCDHWFGSSEAYGTTDLWYLKGVLMKFTYDIPYYGMKRIMTLTDTNLEMITGSS